MYITTRPCPHESTVQPLVTDMTQYEMWTTYQEQRVLVLDEQSHDVRCPRRHNHVIHFHSFVTTSRLHQEQIGGHDHGYIVHCHFVFPMIDHVPQKLQQVLDKEDDRLHQPTFYEDSHTN